MRVRQEDERSQRRDNCRKISQFRTRFNGDTAIIGEEKGQGEFARPPSSQGEPQEDALCKTPFFTSESGDGRRVFGMKPSKGAALLAGFDISNSRTGATKWEGPLGRRGGGSSWRPGGGGMGYPNIFTGGGEHDT